MIVFNASTLTIIYAVNRGASKGRARAPPPPPWDLKNAIFSGFLPLNYVIYIFEVGFLCFLLCGRTEEACSMVNSLRKVDFSHPTGHYTWKKFIPPPLRKSWVRPWLLMLIYAIIYALLLFGYISVYVLFMTVMFYEDSLRIALFLVGRYSYPSDMPSDRRSPEQAP